MPLPKYEFIDSAAAWHECLKVLGGAPRMAVDIEANSLFVYREEVCLIQVSIPGHDYIIDPFAEIDLQPFVDKLQNPAVEKVFHASEYDLILLKRRYDANLANLFDTMWAARILGYKNMGLASFLASHFGVDLSKKHQKSNWGQRPLPDELLEYAQNDTHYLLELRDMLAQELEEKGCMEEALEIFATECDVRMPDRIFDPEGFWGIKGARELRPRTLAVLRDLYLCREEIAQHEDKPPFKILNNNVLFHLAKIKPKTAAAVRDVRGVPSLIRDKYAAQVAEAVQQGCEADLPKRQDRKPRMENGVAERFDRLAEWRKTAARERGVESDVIIKRDAMWAIAHHNPDTLDALQSIIPLGRHRLGLYGESILNELAASSTEVDIDGTHLAEDMEQN